MKEQKNIHNVCEVQLIRFEIGGTQFDLGYHEKLCERGMEFVIGTPMRQYGCWDADSIYSAEELAHQVTTTLIAKGLINPKDLALRTIRNLAYVLWTSNEL